MRLVLVALVALTSCAAVPDPVRLALDLRPGQSFEVAMAVEQDVEQDWGETEAETVQRLVLGWRQDVRGVREDGTAVLDVRYESARLELAGPELGAVSYDSERRGEPVPPFALGLDAMIGEEVRLEVTSTGEVRVTDDVARLIDRVIARIDLPPEVDAAAVRAQLTRRFGERGLKETMQALVSIYPDRPVTVGDRWTRRTRIESGYPHLQESELELVRLDEQTATIRLDARLTTLEDAPPMRSGPVETRMELSGRQKGLLRVDRATGMVVLAELTQELSGTVVQSMAGAEPLRSRIRLRAKIELAVEL